MADDVFCKIINKERPADIIMEGESWLAINDINPRAPVHVLIIPKKHFDFPDVDDSDANMMGELLLAADKVAKKLNLEKGFRIIINKGEHGGQVVPHFHIHLLGGRHLGAKIVADTK